MQEKRLALVIGNASYKTKPLATAVNDAALIAQTLQSAGFDVIGARKTSCASIARFSNISASCAAIF